MCLDHRGCSDTRPHLGHSGDQRNQEGRSTKRSPGHPDRSHHSGRGLRSKERSPGHTLHPPSAQPDPAMPFIEGTQEETRLNWEGHIWSEGSNSVPSVASSPPLPGSLTYVQGRERWGSQKVALSCQAHAARWVYSIPGHSTEASRPVLASRVVIGLVYLVSP